MTTFDTILNTLVPPIIFVVFGWLLIRPFREPLGRLWNWINSMRTKKEETGEEIYSSVRYE